MPDAATPPVILHVEDDPNDVFFVQRAFAKVHPGVTLLTVADGSEAQAYLEGRPPYDDRDRYPMPSLVLMDLKLPKKNGLEVLEWMKGLPTLKAIPVIILSSSTEKCDVERAYELGANAFVAKRGDLKGLVSLAEGIAVYADAVRRRG
jgi:CheY-like chemotaxis protein